MALAFVIAEDLLSTGQLLVDGSMVWECVKIFLCEILVDVLKHVTLAKFNNVRPGTYREFFRYASTWNLVGMFGYLRIFSAPPLQ